MPARSHGMRKTKAYNSWSMMRVRCLNPRDHKFPTYGGRGITICERWSKFENFIEDMGPRPEGTSIDRINNEGNYEPGNCRWATAKEQSRNRSCARQITLNGKTQNLSAWQEELGIIPETFESRRRLGWDIEKCLLTPVRKKTSHKRKEAA